MSDRENKERFNIKKEALLNIMEAGIVLKLYLKIQLILVQYLVLLQL
jgi:hypothetical protein